jgi:hypothetical protein
VGAVIGGVVQHPRTSAAASAQRTATDTSTDTTATDTTTDSTTANTTTGGGDLASLPNQCSSGLAASQSISCSLASNLFYEYHKATQNGGNTTTLSAWSPATKQYYGASCSPGNGVVTCRIEGTNDPNAEVEFTQAAIGAYTPQQASDYAAHADLGPSSAGTPTPLSKAAYEQRLGPLFNNQIDPALRSALSNGGATNPQNLTTAIGLVTEARDAMAAITPPAGIADLHTQAITYLTALINDMSKLRDAARVNDQSAYSGAASAVQSDSQQVQMIGSEFVARGY